MLILVVMQTGRRIRQPFVRHLSREIAPLVGFNRLPQNIANILAGNAHVTPQRKECCILIIREYDRARLVEHRKPVRHACHRQRQQILALAQLLLHPPLFGHITR